MAKTAKLSHSGHTGNLTAWQAEWPTLPDALSLWFALRRAGILPKGQVFANRDASTDWAKRMHLVSGNGKPPEWLLRMVEGSEWTNARADEWVYQNLFTFNLARLWSPPENPNPRKALTLAEALKAPPEGDRAKASVHSGILQESLGEASERLTGELIFQPQNESYSSAHKRIMKAFGEWLKLQLMWCQDMWDGSKTKASSREDMELFIRFQCMNTPVRKMRGHIRAQDDPKGAESKVRKALQRVSKRLKIPLRRERSGRPKKTMEKR